MSSDKNRQTSTQLLLVKIPRNYYHSFQHSKGINFQDKPFVTDRNNHFVVSIKPIESSEEPMETETDS